jgi:hypothetical protein
LTAEFCSADDHSEIPGEPGGVSRSKVNGTTIVVENEKGQKSPFFVIPAYAGMTVELLFTRPSFLGGH